MNYLTTNLIVHNLQRKQKMKKTTLLTLILLVTFATACSSTRGGEPAAEETSQPDDTGDTGGTGDRPVSTKAELITALNEDGATVTEGAPVEDPFFEVEAELLTVNGAEVQVYEFPDEAARQTAQETINATGNIIGSMTVDWMEEPHFFGAGRLIVLYVGDDQAILDLLSARLGEPFTEGGGGFMVPEQSPAVEAALNTLGQELAAAASEFSVTSVEEVEWTDGCLGLGGPDESCLQAITPGLRIMVQLGDRQFEVRTDTTGEIVRWQEIE
jgi:hypothetical protein